MRGRLTVGVLLLTAFATGAFAQSLAEAAAKERERRERERKKSGGAAKVVTDEQLGKSGASLALDGATAEGASERRRSDDEEPPEWADLTLSEREQRQRERARTQTGVGSTGEQRADQETAWRDRARQARARVQTAQDAVARLKAEKDKALGDALRSTDTNEIMRLRGRATELDDEIRQAEGELQDGLDGQRELEDEARQAGVPPGWIREG
jgi:hypothetical protein